MSDPRNMEQSPCRLSIDGELTIRNAIATRDRLLAALADNRELEVDLAGVGEFDSAGVQLLVAARKSASAAGKILRLADPSPAIVEVLDFLGLNGQLAGNERAGDAP